MAHFGALRRRERALQEKYRQSWSILQSIPAAKRPTQSPDAHHKMI
jgi:hypothetical protein